MSPTGEKHTLPPVYGTEGKEQSLLDTSIYLRFAELPQGGKVSAEYVWLGELEPPRGDPGWRLGQT